MQKTLSDSVLTHLRPKIFYRPRDVADEMGVDTSQASAALRELARGGVVERIKEKIRVVYITKQETFF